MKRLVILAVVVCAGGAAPALGVTSSADLAREIVRRIPDWPQAEVEIPIQVYEQYLRGLMAEPALPRPPQSTWIEKAAYRVTLAEKEPQLQATLDVVVLPGETPRAIPVLTTGLSWKAVTLDGRPHELVPMPDGWFRFVPPGPGRYRIVGQAPLKPTPGGDVATAGWRTALAAWAVAEVDSAAPWDVAFKGSDQHVVGTPEGTRGLVALRPGDDLVVTWQKPQPPVAREARIEYGARVGWTLADGVHQVRAALDLTLWGGEVKELSVNLPEGADRVAITGPDVREVQVQGGAARVFLRGAITQRTRLAVAFEVPRRASGPMQLPVFGLVGGSARGGSLAIGGGSGAVLLEVESPGLVPMAVRDLPDETRGLLAAPPIYAYTLGAGAWSAKVDVVGMAEFPVRETLIDSALYTVLYRPDGHVMAKVIYEVRNRAQQYMRVDLPEGATLLVARVSEEQRNLARGPGSSVYVPLEKSVLTTSGLISFPVEIVYVMAAPPLSHEGRLKLPLARADLPIAYARCALSLPDGMKVREWQGALRRVTAWSSETANLEFEYGSGHLAKRADGTDVHLPNREVHLGLFGAANAPFAPQANEPVSDTDIESKVLQGKNFYRAGVDFYKRGDYRKAGELFGKVLEFAPESTEGENAKKYLGNVDIALGKGEKDGGDRTLKATAKAVQRSQQMANTNILEKQEKALQQAEQAEASGDVEKAEAAYQVAVDIAGKLQERGEEAREQTATVRKGKAFLEKAAKQREEDTKEVQQLQRKLSSLKQEVSTKVQYGNGKVVEEAIDALVDLQEAVPDVDANGPVDAGVKKTGGGLLVTSSRGKPSVQVDVKSKALAEQQVALGAKPQPVAKDSAGAYFFSGAESRDKVQDLQKKVEQLEVLHKKLDESKPAEGDGRYSGEGRGRVVVARGGGVAAKELREEAPDKPLRKLQEAKEELQKVEPAKERLDETVTEMKKLEDSLKHAAEKPEPDVATKIQRYSELKTTYDKLRDEDGRQRAARVEAGEKLPQAAEKLEAEFETAEKPRPVPSTPLARSDKKVPVLGDVPILGRLQEKVAEKSRSQVVEDARRAESLAREGKVAEAEELLSKAEEKQSGQSALGLLPSAGGKPRSGRPAQAQAAPKMAQVEVAQKELEQRAATDLEMAETNGDEMEGAREAPARARELGQLDKLESLDHATRMPGKRTRDGGWDYKLADTQHEAADQTPGEPDPLDRVRRVIEDEKRNRSSVQFGVNDLTATTDGGKKLAEFVTRNYGWALRSNEGQGPRNAANGTPQGQTAANPFPDVATNSLGEVSVLFTDGNLSVANDPNATENVKVILERLRANMGQRVAVGSRNLFLGASRAASLGVSFKEGANGVRWGVINEGQLRGLMDLEQRSSLTAENVPDLPRDVQQEAVVGTGALIANGGTLTIAGAADESNTLSYNGNDVPLAHDDYVVFDNGSYLTVVKSGRMQHWAAEAEPVRFPGVPAAVVVPAVGHTVKFEKTLLDPKDALELVTEYTWQGEEK